MERRTPITSKEKRMRSSKVQREVGDSLEEAEDALQRAGPSDVVEKAKNALKKGKELLVC